MAVNYLGFAQAVNASNPMAEGIKQLAATIEARRERERLAPQEAQAATLRNLQIQQAQSGIDETTAKRNSLVDLYGTKGQPDEYSRAMSFQAQEEKDKAAKKAEADAYKLAMDGYVKVSEAVKNGVLDENQAGSFYHNTLRLAGIDLEKAGVSMEFKKQGGYYSGPVAPDSLFMINGKPTPYGGAGTISKARIAGIDPTTNKPIFEMTADTTFAQEKKEVGKPFSREYDEGDTRVTELYDASGKLTGTKRAPRYKPAAAGGGTPVAQTTFVDPATGNPLTFDKSTGTYRVATVVGGGVAPKPSAMSPEAAGKAQMIEQGITYMPTLRQELFDKDGSVNRTNVANLVTGTPGTRGRELRTLLLDAVEAKLRAESGAAVPEPEVKRAAKRFIPNPMDSANNVKIKLDNLEAYLKGTAAKINKGRGGDKPSGGNGKPIVTKGGFKVTRVP